MDIISLIFAADTSQLTEAERRLRGLGSAANAAQGNASGLGRSLDWIRGIGGPIGDAADRVAALGSRLGGLGGPLGIVIGAKIGIESVGFAMANLADEADEMAQKMGVSMEQLEKLKLIAGENGTSVESLQRTYDKLTKSLNKFDEDNDKTAYAFKVLGIAASDLANRTEAEIAGVVVKRWEDLDRTAKATAATMQLIGPAFREQIPAIKAAAEAGDEYLERVRKFGSEASPALVKAGGEQEKALSNLGLAWKGIANEVAEHSKGMIASAADWSANMLNNIRSVLREWREGRAAMSAADNVFSLEERQKLMKQARENIGTGGSPVDVNAEFQRLKIAAQNTKFRQSEIAGYGETNDYFVEAARIAKLKKDSAAARMPEKGGGGKVDPLAWMKDPAYVAELAKAQMRSAAKNADYEAGDKAAQENKLATMREQSEAIKRNATETERYNEGLARQAEQYRAFIDPNYTIITQLKQVNELEAQGLLNTQEATKARSLLQQQIIAEQNTFRDGWTNAFTQYQQHAYTSAQAGQDAFSAATSAMEGAINQFAATGKISFGDFARSVIGNLAQIYAKMVATQLIGMVAGLFTGSYSFNGGVGTTNAAGISGGRATGGPVSPFKTYMVGERGPELLQLGSQGGNVVPNHAMSGGTVQNITVAVSVEGGKDAQETGDIVSAKVVQMMRGIVKQELATDKRAVRYAA